MDSTGPDRNRQGKDTSLLMKSLHELSRTDTNSLQACFDDSVYESLLRSTLDGFGMIDGRGRILEANDAYAQMSGYTRKELLSMSVYDLESDPTGPALQALIKELKESGASRYRTRHRRKDGSLWEAEGVIRAMPPEIGGFFCFIRDVTEQTQLEEELKLKAKKLEEQNAMKDKLFIILAHDLRGPIGNLNTLLNFISDQPMESEQFKTFMEEGKKSASQTYNLLENLLGWVRSKIDEVVALRMRAFVFHTLVAVQDWMEPQARAKQIKLLVECPKELTVVTDERMLETIIRNLVSNALKFSGGGSTVILRGRMLEDEIVAEVIDEGEGIPPEKVALLFQGQKVDSRTGTNGERGNGLGLMFSFDLARSLGGRMGVESKVGQGSTFRLFLPDTVDDEL